MRRLLFIAVVLPALAAAQAPWTWTISLEGPWRFTLGDEPGYARPDLDDSRWRLVQVPVSWVARGARETGGWGWYRRRLVLSPEQVEQGDVGLFLPSAGAVGYEVFANGEMVGRAGALPPAEGWRVAPARQAIRIPERLIGDDGRLQLAIRLYYEPLVSSARAGLSNVAPVIGSWSAIRRLPEQVLGARVYSGLFELLVASAGLLIAGLLLAFGRRDHPEYGWFALVCVANAIDVAVSIWTPPDGLTSLATGAMRGIKQAATIRFFWVFLRAPLRWWMRVLELASLLGLTVMFAGNFYVRLQAPSVVATVASMTSLVVAVAFLARRALSGDPDARALLPAGGLSSLFWFLLFGSVLLRALGLLGRSAAFGPVLATAPALAALSFFVGGGILLLRRNERMSRERERLHQEFETARAVQQLLLPSARLQTTQVSVSSVYRPASEVGGDFYQVFPSPDGSVLVLVGDVTGKGLRPAMLVSLAVGALRRICEQTHSPATVLTELNRVLDQQAGEGFVTCLAVLWTADGSLVAANAGHPVPYADGRELDLAPALPLGVAAETEYEESRIPAPNALLLFSDGIIEARNADGELFGYHRLERAMASGLTLDEIATAAEQFGHADDITVVEMRRVHAVEPAGVKMAGK